MEWLIYIIMRRENMRKQKPMFTHIPNWLGIYHPGKITINNP